MKFGSWTYDGDQVSFICTVALILETGLGTHRHIVGYLHRTETHLPAQVEAQASPIFICLNKSPIINVVVVVVVPTPPPAVPTYTYIYE